jgi:hypothetical protein
MEQVQLTLTVTLDERIYGKDVDVLIAHLNAQLRGLPEPEERFSNPDNHPHEFTIEDNRKLYGNHADDLPLIARGEAIANLWQLGDIYNVDDDLTEPEAKAVLYLLEHEHDANVGINWDVIETWVNMVRDGECDSTVRMFTSEE